MIQKKVKWIDITILVISILLLIGYLAIPVLTFSGDSIFADKGINGVVFLWSYFTASTSFSILHVLLGFIYFNALWDIINSILFLSLKNAKQTKYYSVNKILSLIFTIISLGGILPFIILCLFSPTIFAFILCYFVLIIIKSMGIKKHFSKNNQEIKEKSAL